MSSSCRDAHDLMDNSRGTTLTIPDEMMNLNESHIFQLWFRG